MNIDLFLSPHGESGLLCAGSFDKNPSGVIFDAQTRELTLEFEETGETLHLNIPVEDEHKDLLLFSHKIYVSNLEEGLISESLQVPMLYLNDPYGSSFADGSPMTKGVRSLIGFEQFMKRCSFAQAVHRDNLSDESTIGSVLQGINPKTLQYIPQLVRDRMLEAAPKVGPAGPEFSVPSPDGPMGGTSSTRRRRVMKKTPPKDSEEK